MLHQLSLSKKRGVKLDWRANLAKIGRFVMIVVFLASLVGVPTRSVNAAATITFTGGELLGKPTDTSIVINIVPDTTIEYHYQYGTASGSYTSETDNATATGGQPHEVTIEGLTPNTQYFYRMQYHAPGDAMDDWVNRSEYSFWTQRAEDSSFVFTVEADSHAQMNTSHQNAMVNVDNENPDFHIDLGDTFYPGNVSSQSAVDQSYLAYRDSLYMGRIGPSVPIFLVAGNHEDEEGWNLDDTPFSVAVGSIQARKAYYPTPIDDGFYSANTDPLASINEATYGDEFREDYYAWTWGDALFIVIDVFQYTMQNPYGAIAGEGSDDPVTGDQWSWTLGAEQYNWLRETLEGSDAKYKFVFSHNMLGGIPRDISVNPAGYVRGGAEAAAYFEWGGRNADGTAGFASHRDPAVFGTKPIHQLFVENGVSAYFHGHDHQYVYETRDGVVYQEVPSPSMTGSGFSGIYTEGTYAEYQTIEMLPNAGHLRVSVTPTQATVDYISASSTTGSVNYSYNITPSVVGPTYTLTTAVSPTGSGETTPSVGNHTYAEGAVVEVTAAPNAGYIFDSWSGACSGSGACSVTMDADKTVTANFVENASAARQDGAVSSVTGDDVSTLSFSHTTGTGTNRLMLVGVSWNSGTTATSISSITFEGQALSQVGMLQYPSQNRYTAIYSLLSPASGVTGTVTITFSDTVGNGIVAGAVNFAGVDQATPLGTFTGATGTDTANPSVALTGLSGNELVFDSLFAGGNPAPTLTVDASQTLLWAPAGIANASGGASIEQAVGSSVTMSWTRDNTNYWAIAAVPIRPAAAGTTYNLTVAADPAGAGTTTPAVGVHAYAEGSLINVTASPAAGYVFDSWSGACSGSGTCQVTMDADKSVTANFTEIPTTGVVVDGVVSSNTGDGVSSLSFSHTTGTGANRLTLVGVSANSYSTSGGQSISSVNFTYGATELPLSLVGSVENESGRLAAIYGLLDPPSGQAGTVTVTFSGSVDYGIAAGAINFAGVDQINPYGTFASNTGTETTDPTVNVVTAANDLVFDTMFLGGATIGTLAAGTGQIEQWNETVDRVGGAASTEVATGANTQMSWMVTGGATTRYWAIGAVPIHPVSSATTYTLSTAVSPSGSGETTPSIGSHTYAEGAVVAVTAAPNVGYVFDSWSGACTGSGACSVTMDADKTVTANFTEDLTPHVVLDGAVSSATGDDVSTLSWSHTTGTGANRLMLVSVSWNSGTAATSISGVTFDGQALSQVGTLQYPSQNRYTAIYSLLAPASGVTGTVAITFSASVGNGIVAGAANFAGVDQTTPLGSFVTATGTDTADPSVELTGLAGNELVFDSLFAGGNPAPTLTVDASQTLLWAPAGIANASGGASIEQAVGSSVTMSWTRDNTNYWAIAAVPIRPAAAGTTYNLTVAADPVGAGTTSPAVGGHAYAAGSVVNVTATPAAGYMFDSWSGACTGSGACSVTMDADKTVTANFTEILPDCYPLTLNHTGNGSNPSAGPANSDGCAVGQYVAGESISLSGATPDTGWQISGWSGTNNNSSTAGTNMVTMPASAHTASVTYTQVEYTLTIVSEHGTVTRNPNQATYHYGDVVALSVTSDPGWTFTNWTPALTGNQVTITGDMTVTANYSQDEYTLTVVSAHGTVTRNPNQATYHYGDVVTLSATADLGYTFTGWTPELTNNQVTIQGNTTVTANYTQNEYTLTIVSGHGTVTRTPDQASYHYGDVVTLSVVASPGWTFTNWTPSLTNNQVTITGDMTVTANYTQDEYTLTIVSEHGTVTRNPDQVTYHYGDVVTLSATADPGWTFTSWTPALTGNQVTIQGNTTVTANYAETEYALTIASNLNPSVYGQLVTFTATVTSTGAAPAGTVTFYADGATLGTVPLDGNGEAALSTAALEPATHSITADYVGAVGNCSGMLTGGQVVNPVPITITAVALGKVYGETDPAPLTYTITSGTLIPGDSLTGSLSRVAGEDADTYAITQGTLTNANNPHYDITFVGASFTITQATLTVTANDQTRKYLEENPALTYTITGFVRGDTVSVVTGSPVLSTTAIKSSPEGEYPITITAGSLQADNYNFVMVNGKLTITENEFRIFMPCISKN